MYRCGTYGYNNNKSDSGKKQFKFDFDSPGSDSTTIATRTEKEQEKKKENKSNEADKIVWKWGTTSSKEIGDEYAFSFGGGIIGNETNVDITAEF